MNAGEKQDSGKARWDAVPSQAMAAVVDVLTYGAEKYDETPGDEPNWTRVENGRRRFWTAAQRHLWANRNEEHLDAGTGCPHLACAIADLLFVLELEIREGL